MIYHLKLHPSWDQSLLFATARKRGVSLGKDSHWHFNGITGLYVLNGDSLVLEIIEKPGDYTSGGVTRVMRQIQARLLQDAKKHEQ